MTKRAWIVAAIIALVAGIGLYLTRFASHAKRLFVDVASVMPTGVGGVMDLISGFKLNVEVLLKNFSSSAFNVNQLKIDLYSPNGTKLAEQPAPLQESKHLKPNQNNTLDMEFDANLHGFADLLMNEAKDINSLLDAKDRLMAWVTTGELGVTVVAKGFVQAEGVKIDINEDVQI